MLPVVSPRASYCSPSPPSTDSLLLSSPRASRLDGSMEELMRSTPTPEPSSTGHDQGPTEIDPFMRSTIPPTWNQTGNRRQTQLLLLLEELDVLLRDPPPLARLSLSDNLCSSDEDRPSSGTPSISYVPGYEYSSTMGVMRSLASPPPVLNLHEGITHPEEWASPITEGDSHDHAGTLGHPLGKLVPSPADDPDLAAYGTVAVPLNPFAQATATTMSECDGSSSSAFEFAWIARLKRISQRRLVRPNNPAREGTKLTGSTTVPPRSKSPYPASKLSSPLSLEPSKLQDKAKVYAASAWGSMSSKVQTWRSKPPRMRKESFGLPRDLPSTTQRAQEKSVDRGDSIDQSNSALTSSLVKKTVKNLPERIRVDNSRSRKTPEFKPLPANGVTVWC